MTCMLVSLSGLAEAADAADAQRQGSEAIKITAKRFEYSPNEIHVKKNVPVVIEFTALDRLHGFVVPQLNIRSNIEPGKITRVTIVFPDAGTYDFHCDIFCGDGHEDMTGKFIVEE